MHRHLCPSPAPGWGWGAAQKDKSQGSKTEPQISPHERTDKRESVLQHLAAQVRGVHIPVSWWETAAGEPRPHAAPGGRQCGRGHRLAGAAPRASTTRTASCLVAAPLGAGSLPPHIRGECGASPVPSPRAASLSALPPVCPSADTQGAFCLPTGQHAVPSAEHPPASLNPDLHLAVSFPWHREAAVSASCRLRTAGWGEW